MRSKVASALVLLVMAAAPAFAEGRKIVRERQPLYPEMARKFALHGTVTLQVTVASNGHVTEAKVTGGHPILAKAAVDAVQNWVFEPSAGATIETVRIEFKE